ncbi:AbrB/MazE/SpoVT family DNA-binding domain-containing protein [Crossiella sp. CA198]|uniref:AbrB/MazE/SpoVT family DNA-binding domain-containing protein n=1 Tax=Crossiella sp. CA198 TaxID=3455607 RepID=UPI003F8CF904
MLDAAVIVVIGRRGPHTLNRQGRLRLPASVRHQCGLTAGDRLLVVALPGQDFLVVYTPVAVGSILLAHHARARQEPGR